MMKSCLLLLLLISVCYAEHQHGTYGIALLIDTSEDMADLVRAVKVGAEELMKEGARKFQDYSVIPFAIQTIQSSNLTHFKERITSIHPQPINSSEKAGFEYYQMLRAVELPSRESIVIYFTDTLHVINSGYSENAVKKHITIHIFLTNCCLDCSHKEIEFREYLKRHGHGVYCIMLSDVKKIFKHVAKLETNLRSREGFELLIRKSSLTFAVDISRNMGLELQVVRTGVLKVVNELPRNVMTFAVFSRKNVYKFVSTAEVEQAFKLRLLNTNMTLTLLNDRIKKSVYLSEKGSVIFSISRKLFLLPNASILQSAKSKDVAILFFLTNCCQNCSTEVQIQNYTVQGHGVFCVTPAQLLKMMNYLHHQSSERPFNMHPLRQVSTYIELFRIPKTKESPTNSTKTVNSQRIHNGTNKNTTEATKTQRPVSIDTSKYALPPRIPNALKSPYPFPIVLNASINIGDNHHSHHPHPSYIFKCGCSNLQLPYSILFLGLTIASWT